MRVLRPAAFVLAGAGADGADHCCDGAGKRAAGRGERDADGASAGCFGRQSAKYGEYRHGAGFGAGTETAGA